MLIFKLFSLRVYIKKTVLEITLHHMGNLFISKLIEIKFRNWRDIFFLILFLLLNNYGMDLLFSGNNEIIECTYIWDSL